MPDNRFAEINREVERQQQRARKPRKTREERLGEDLQAIIEELLEIARAGGRTISLCPTCGLPRTL